MFASLKKCVLLPLAYRSPRFWSGGSNMQLNPRFLENLRAASTISAIRSVERSSSAPVSFSVWKSCDSRKARAPVRQAAIAATPSNPRANEPDLKQSSRQKRWGTFIFTRRFLSGVGYSAGASPFRTASVSSSSSHKVRSQGKGMRRSKPGFRLFTRQEQGPTRK